MFGFNVFYLPQHRKEKFQRIEFSVCFLQRRQLLFFLQILSYEYQLKRFQESTVDFFSQGIFGGFFDMDFELMPELVTTN